MNISKFTYDLQGITHLTPLNSECVYYLISQYNPLHNLNQAKSSPIPNTLLELHITTHENMNTFELLLKGETNNIITAFYFSNHNTLYWHIINEEDPSNNESFYVSKSIAEIPISEENFKQTIDELIDYTSNQITQWNTDDYNELKSYNTLNENFELEEYIETLPSCKCDTALHLADSIYSWFNKRQLFGIQQAPLSMRRLIIMLYVTQNRHIMNHGTPLFSEKFIFTPEGITIPEVYAAYQDKLPL